MLQKSADELTEENLAIRASAGDLHAFNTLINNWNKRIYNFSLRYLGNHDEAQEAAQQTFIKAYQRIGSLKEGNQFRAWLYVIAGNTCRDALRRSSRSQTESIDSANVEHIRENASSGQPEQRVARQDMAKLLKRALAQLPDEQRVVLILKEYEGLKFTEIARILDEPESTIKSRLYYALKTMRKLLKPYQHETL
jgi:RNA polymerase sigma-70 factor (ECF subfamily)